MVYIRVADTQEELNNYFDKLPHNGIGKVRGSKRVEYEIKQAKEIYYTSTDGKVVTPNSTGFDVFGAILLSNTYEDGVGVMKFKGYVKCIGNNAFSDNDKLETILVDGGLNYIGANAFKNCTSLRQTNIKNGVIKIKESAFENTALESIYIPVSTTYIGAMAFDNCSNITSITVENGNLYYTSNNGNAIYDEKEKTIIRGCENTVMDSKYSEYKLGAGAFSGCKNLKTAIISDVNTEIPTNTFSGCQSLENVIFNTNTLDNIGDKAFYRCDMLTAITFPETVKVFGVSSFQTCNKLREVTLPTNCDMLSQNAFQGCTKLNKIVSPNTNPPSLMYGVFNDTNNCPIYVPMNSRATYAWDWNGYPNVVSRIVGY